MFHWTTEKGIVIVSSANKKIFGNSLRRYTNIFSHISWYSRCMNDALIVVWSESYSTNTFCFFNTCSLQRIGKILNEDFNLLQTIEWLAVQNWGSSHKDEQNISSLNEPSLFLRSAIKISVEVDLRVKAELSDFWIRVASLKESISISMYSLLSGFLPVVTNFGVIGYNSC